MQSRTATWAMIVGTATVLALAAPALGHEGNNHGTVKVHDDESVDPATRNDPHVSCDFWIEGFNMSDDSGHIEFELIPPTENPPESFGGSTDWTGTPDDDGFAFNEGPFNFDAEVVERGGAIHVRVTVYVDQGHPGSEDHFAKQKVFWVHPCEPNGGPQEGPNCPDNLTATAERDGDIHLDWDAVEGADGYNIYRRVAGEEDFDLLATTGPGDTDYTDSDTELRVTYEYMVTSFDGAVESEDCDIVEARAIPFFTDPATIGVAAVGGVAALALLRRKP